MKTLLADPRPDSPTWQFMSWCYDQASEKSSAHESRSRKLPWSMLTLRLLTSPPVPPASTRTIDPTPVCQPPSIIVCTIKISETGSLGQGSSWKTKRLPSLMISLQKTKNCWLNWSHHKASKSHGPRNGRFELIHDDRHAKYDIYDEVPMDWSWDMHWDFLWMCLQYTVQDCDALKSG